MIRAIITPKNTDLHITIPQEYVGKELELIAYTIDEGKQGMENRNIESNLLELLSSAHVMNEFEYKIFLEKRKHFNTWK